MFDCDAPRPGAAVGGGGANCVFFDTYGMQGVEGAPGAGLLYLQTRPAIIADIDHMWRVVKDGTCVRKADFVWAFYIFTGINPLLLCLFWDCVRGGERRAGAGEAGITHAQFTSAVWVWVDSLTAREDLTVDRVRGYLTAARTLLAGRFARGRGEQLLPTTECADKSVAYTALYGMLPLSRELNPLANLALGKRGSTAPPPPSATTPSAGPAGSLTGGGGKGPTARAAAEAATATAAALAAPTTTTPPLAHAAPPSRGARRASGAAAAALPPNSPPLSTSVGRGPGDAPTIARYPGGSGTSSSASAGVTDGGTSSSGWSSSAGSGGGGGGGPPRRCVPLGVAALDVEGCWPQLPTASPQAPQPPPSGSSGAAYGAAPRKFPTRDYLKLSGRPPTTETRRSGEGGALPCLQGSAPGSVVVGGGGGGAQADYSGGTLITNGNALPRRSVRGAKKLWSLPVWRVHPGGGSGATPRGEGGGGGAPVSGGRSGGDHFLSVRSHPRVNACRVLRRSREMGGGVEPGAPGKPTPRTTTAPGPGGEGAAAADMPASSPALPSCPGGVMIRERVEAFLARTSTCHAMARARAEAAVV